MTKTFKRPYKILLRIPSLLGLICCVIIFQSCFTGIEGTKKINLTREDRKKSEPTQEENFFPGIKGEPISKWEEGRIFFASDNKMPLVFDTKDMIFARDTFSVKGKIFEFIGVESKINPAGNLTLVILFTDGARKMAYDTNRDFDEALQSFTSVDLPMMIDSKMVEEARRQLLGEKLWIKSDLWYDEKGERIPGKKYVEVTITDIKPGDTVFPLFLTFTDSSGETAHAYMNFGNSPTESRSFLNLFSITDIRRHYPSIETETWELISIGKVRPGMTKEECRLALGNPSDVNSGHDYSQTLDIWLYDNGKTLWFEDGRLTRVRQ